MKEKNSSQPKVSFRQKLVLVLLGLILSLALLEGALRLGGFVLLSLQEYGNLRSSQEKGAYRILCLGESTTEGQYPFLLEKALNERNIGVRFSVIDKGLGGTRTPAILSHVESFLDEYHPDMVVAMMGINDWGIHMPLEVPTTSKGALFIRSLRTYKLARLLWLHLLTKIEEMKLDKTAHARQSSENITIHLPKAASQAASNETILTEDSFKRALEINPKNDHACTGLGRVYLDQGKLPQAEELFKKALAINPKNDHAYAGQGWLYLAQGRISKAEESFKNAIGINPENDHACTGLGRVYLDQGKLPQAEELFKKALAINPKNDPAYAGQGWLYSAQGRISQAGESFKIAIVINPKNDHAYTGLGWLYLAQGKFSQAEEFFKKAIQLDPEKNDPYAGLGRLYQEQGRFSKAEDFFKKATEINPKNDFAYAGLGRVCQDQGKLTQAEESFKEAFKLNPKNDHAYTGLARFYQEQGKLPQAEDILKKAIAINPENDRIMGALSLLYEQIGKPELGEAYAEKAERLREYDNPLTKHHYRKLKEILDQHRIKLVCVQYPMRNVRPLKKLFEKEEGVIFVDNERVFKEAVRKGSYKEYFADMFAGDFGHCTRKGNTLLAQNIADVILREAFNKSQDPQTVL